MKNFKNNLTNKNYNSNRTPNYKAISLASLSALSLTLNLGDITTASAMMTKSGAIKFYGSNGNRTISGIHTKLSSSPKLTSVPKVNSDIAGRFPAKSTVTSSSKTHTTSMNQNTSSSSLKNNASSSNMNRKPITSTQSNIQYAKDGTPFVHKNGENYTYVTDTSKGTTTKISIDFNENKNPIYYTKNPSGSVTYLQKVGHNDDGIVDFKPTLNNKPVVSVGTQTDPDITGGKTNTLTSKKPTTPNQSSSNDGKYNATLVELDDDGNIIKPNNSGSPTLKPTQQLDPDGNGTNNNALTSKRPNTPNQSSSNDGKYNATLVELDDNGNIIQQNNAGTTTSQITTETGNKKLTKKDKIALGVVGGVAGLGTILGLSIGLTNNGGNNSNKNNDGTPPKLVPVPSSPKYSISVVSSPKGNLFTDN